MTMGTENLGGGPATAPERFAGQLAYRSGRREMGMPPDEQNDHGLVPRNAFPLPTPSPMNGGGPELDPADELERSPALSSMGLGGLNEPVFPPAGWLEEPAGSLVDHPLLRGLLMELPPKGAVPPQGWLDRWFEAARSILELLYTEGNRPRPR
jgi:hypothetical protein